MGLYKPLLSNESLLAASKILTQTRKANITIIAPQQTDGDYNFDTGAYDNLPNTVVAANLPARVQPIRSSVRRDMSGNETEIKSVLITLGFEHNALDIALGMKIVVNSTDLATPLPSYEMYVNDYANSSNPLERAFYCTFNLEVNHV